MIAARDRAKERTTTTTETRALVRLEWRICWEKESDENRSMQRKTAIDRKVKKATKLMVMVHCYCSQLSRKLLHKHFFWMVLLQRYSAPHSSHSRGCWV